jgi:phosphoglycerate kinase
MKSITDVPKEYFIGKRVIVRSGLNVPIKDGVIEDALRIQRAIPTLTFLQSAGARICIIAHIGREKTETLQPIFLELQKIFPHMQFIPHSPASPEALVASHSMHDGDMILYENVRSEDGETENDEHLARALAALGDVYVGDAFPDAHRAHASIVGVPALLPHFSGLALAEEVTQLTHALHPSKPSLAIIGGAKFETKEPLIRTLLEHYDAVFVGGALANDLLASRGFPVGASVIEDGKVAADFQNNERLIAPLDVIVERDGAPVTVELNAVLKTDIIVDCGPKTIEHLGALISEATCIVWNGPLGWYEKGYRSGSVGIGEMIRAAHDHATTIVGGGDTVAAMLPADSQTTHLQYSDLEKEFTFLSAGGGAMIEFLIDGTLPGIDALR